MTLSSNWDAHSTDVGTDAGDQGPLSSTNRIWIWNLLQISALPFLWMTRQTWNRRMFNGICWTGLIMICSQTLGSSWTHRPDGCMACFWWPQRHVLCRAQALASCWVPSPAPSWGAVWASTSLTSLLLSFPTCKVGVVILFVEQDSGAGRDCVYMLSWVPHTLLVFRTVKAVLLQLSEKKVLPVFEEKQMLLFLFVVFSCSQGSFSDSYRVWTLFLIFFKMPA